MPAMIRRISISEPQKPAATGTLRSYISQACMALLVLLTAPFTRTFTARPMQKKGLRSSLKPPVKSRYRVSSMNAVAKSHALAKAWVGSIKSKKAADIGTPPLVRLSEELMWQRRSLSPLTLESLARLDEREFEEQMGSRLYNLVKHLEANRAQKITGMLLELGTQELLQMLAPPTGAAGVNAVRDWVREATRVLELDEDSASVAKPLPKAPPPSPAQAEWQVASRRRRTSTSKSNEAAFSMEDLELKLGQVPTMMDSRETTSEC